MFQFLPLLIGAGLGAATSKKPLQGALLGGAGGALTGGLLGGSEGLLGNAGAAATYGTGMGTQQTAMLAAQDAGMGGGLLGAMKDAAPAAMTGIQAAQAAMPQEQPIQSAGLPQQQGFDASGLIGANNQQLAAMIQKRQQRRGLA